MGVVLYQWVPLLVFLLQSVTALTATQRDLGEFVNVLQQDTSAAVTNAATTIKGLLATVSVFKYPILPIPQVHISYHLWATEGRLH